MKIECRVCGRATDAFLCYKPCTEELEQAFGDLPGLLGDVVDSLTRDTRVYRSARQPTSPDEDWRGGDDALEARALPVDFDAGALLLRAGNTLSTWARHLAEARGLHFAPIPAGPTCERCTHASCTRIRNAGKLVGDIDTPHRAAALVRWFLLNRNAIRYDEAAADLHTQILRLRDDLRRFVDRSPSPFYAGPCHAPTTEPDLTVKLGDKPTPIVARGQCQRDLYAWLNPFAIHGGDNPTVTCSGYRSRVEADTGCGTIHTLADRYEWLLDSVEDALLPLATWQAALPKLFPALSWPRRETWWRWAFGDEGKRRLFAKSIDRAGVELFRGGDIVELVRAEQARIKPKSGKIAS